MPACFFANKRSIYQAFRDRKIPFICRSLNFYYLNSPLHLPMYRRILYLLFFGLFFSACNPHLKTEANNLPQGVADSQVVGSWKITAFSSNAPYDWDRNGSTETDIYNLWTACEKDNLYVFVGDKTGTFKINCNVSGNGIWQIYNTEQLGIAFLGQPMEVERFVVGTMTSNQFKTQITVIVSTGQEFTLIKTWTRL